MYNTQIMGCKGIRAECPTENCLKLRVESEVYGFDREGNFSEITYTEEILLYDLPYRVKDALVSALDDLAKEDAA